MKKSYVIFSLIALFCASFSGVHAQHANNNTEILSRILSKYNLNWGASIQTFHDAFKKVWNYNGEPTDALFELDDNRWWEEYTSLGIRVFSCTNCDDVFYFYKNKLYKITTSKDTREGGEETWVEFIYFAPNVEKLLLQN